MPRGRSTGLWCACLADAPQGGLGLLRGLTGTLQWQQCDPASAQGLPREGGCSA